MQRVPKCEARLGANNWTSRTWAQVGLCTYRSAKLFAPKSLAIGGKYLEKFRMQKLCKHANKQTLDIKVFDQVTKDT